MTGTIELNIPEGTQSGTSLKMKGRGVQRLQSTSRGDQYVRIKVEIPRKLNEKQKDLLRAFDEAMGGTFENNISKKDSSEKNFISSLNFFTILAARAAPTPLMAPDAR